MGRYPLFKSKRKELRKLKIKMISNPEGENRCYFTAITQFSIATVIIPDSWDYNASKGPIKYDWIQVMKEFRSIEKEEVPKLIGKTINQILKEGYQVVLDHYGTANIDQEGKVISWSI